ncbi:MAG: ferredoxin reductase family protein [Bacteroidota bacterium]
MRVLKQEIYFPIIVGIHFLFWALDLYFYQGSFAEVSSDTLFFGDLTNETWANAHRILGEVFSSWVITVFAFNFLMATRARWVEKLFGGLDKMYLIHRRSGVIAIVLLLAHFMVVPRDLVEFNLGKPLGFYAFILILLGVLISAAPVFKRKIPYHKWINIHKLMGFFYVMGVVHGLMVNSLIKELPITRAYVFGMSFIGIAAWIYRAFLFPIFNKKLKYEIAVLNDKGFGITEILLKADDIDLNFQAGQFAFFSFPNISKKEQHPFTISSHPDEDYLRIIIKGLGDYTQDIYNKLQVGNTAWVEGPYGHFSRTNIDERRQIWLAGGIGITPYLSLAKAIREEQVRLYWCVNDADEAIYQDELSTIAAQNPNFSYTIWASSDQGYLTVNKMAISGYKDQAYLICGPEALKHSFVKQFKSKGVRNQAIYDESFAFR